MFEHQAMRHGGLVLYEPAIALEFIEACRQTRIAISGIEGFELVGGERVMPRMDLILDLSSLFQNHESDLVEVAAVEARSFLAACLGSAAATIPDGRIMWDFTVRDLEEPDK
jgi:hypothetical protein